MFLLREIDLENPEVEKPAFAQVETKVEPTLSLPGVPESVSAALWHLQGLQQDAQEPALEALSREEHLLQVAPSQEHIESGEQHQLCLQAGLSLALIIISSPFNLPITTPSRIVAVLSQPLKLLRRCIYL